MYYRKFKEQLSKGGFDEVLKPLYGTGRRGALKVMSEKRKIESLRSSKK